MTKEEFAKRVNEAYYDQSKMQALWADIEAERGVVIDWSLAPKGAIGASIHFTEWPEGPYKGAKGVAGYITRPAPKYREMSYPEKRAELLDYAHKLSDPDKIDDLCKAAGIETRVEIK